jgi:hypothetical protein
MLPHQSDERSALRPPSSAAHRCDAASRCKAIDYDACDPGPDIPRAESRHGVSTSWIDCTLAVPQQWRDLAGVVNAPVAWRHADEEPEAVNCAALLLAILACGCSQSESPASRVAPPAEPSSAPVGHIVSTKIVWHGHERPTPEDEERQRAEHPVQVSPSPYLLDQGVYPDRHR